MVGWIFEIVTLWTHRNSNTWSQDSVEVCFGQRILREPCGFGLEHTLAQNKVLHKCKLTKGETMED